MITRVAPIVLCSTCLTSCICGQDEALVAERKPRHSPQDAPTPWIDSHRSGERSKTEIPELGPCQPLIYMDQNIFAATREKGILRKGEGSTWDIIHEDVGDPCGLVGHEGRIFWSDIGTKDRLFRDGRILWVDSDGSRHGLIADKQAGPTSMAAGRDGIYWITPYTGELWRAHGTEVAVVATFPSDNGSHEHGPTSEGMTSSGHSIVWASIDGATRKYKLMQYSEVELSTGILFSTEEHFTIPRGVAAVNDDVWFYIFSLGASGFRERILHIQLNLKHASPEEYWIGDAVFLAPYKDAILWGNSNNQLYYGNRDGHITKLSAIWPHQGPTATAIGNDTLYWQEDHGRIASVHLE